MNVQIVINLLCLMLKGLLVRLSSVLTFRCELGRLNIELCSCFGISQHQVKLGFTWGLTLMQMFKIGSKLALDDLKRCEYLVKNCSMSPAINSNLFLIVATDVCRRGHC